MTNADMDKLTLQDLTSLPLAWQVFTLHGLSDAELASIDAGTPSEELDKKIQERSKHWFMVIRWVSVWFTAPVADAVSVPAAKTAAFTRVHEFIEQLEAHDKHLRGLPDQIQ